MQLQKTQELQVVNFKSWSRKNYAVFNSLKKLIKICTLVLSYTLVTTPLSAQKQTDTILITENTDIDEVVITASHDEMELSEVARMVHVITNQEISSQPVGNINSLLSTTSFTDLRQRGPQGVQADLGIKGGTHNQNLILLNNSYFNNPQTGHHNLNLPFDPLAITKVEILEGSASRIWGPNAFSGVVNFQTIPTRQSKSRLKLELGQHGYLNGAISLVNLKGAPKHKFDAYVKRSNGYITNTDFFATGFLYTGKYNYSKITVIPDLSIGYKRFGAQNYYSANYPLQHEYTKNISASVKTKLKSPLSYSTNTFVNMATDRFELFRTSKGFYEKNKDGLYIYNNDTIPSWYRNPNFHYTISAGHQSRIKLNSKLGKTFLGASILHEKVLSSNLGDPLNDAIDAFLDEEGQYTRSKTRNSFNVFADHQAQAGKIFFDFGVLAHYSNYSNKVKLYPGIDISWQLNQHLNIYSSYNYAYRYPTFTELYYYDGVSKGSINLKPEQAQNFEVGAYLNQNNVQISSSIYYAFEKNSIDFLRSDTATNPLYIASNVASYKKAGINLNTKIITQHIPTVHLINFGFMYNYIVRNTSEYEARYTLNQLKYKFTSTLIQKIGRNLELSYDFQLYQRNGMYEKRNNDGTYTDKPYDQVALVNFKAGYQYKQIQFYYRVSNIFNNKYIDFGNIEQPGIWHQVGVQVELK